MPDFQSSSELTPEIPGTSIDPAIIHGGRACARRWPTAGSRATALTRHYLDRIADVNPALRAVIAVLPDALEQAAASDAAWRSGRPARPLEGIPVLVKDNVQVAGLRRPRRARRRCSAARPPDAFIISRLRAAGAVILAKANLSEWANFRSTRSTSGWSTLGGQTANPYALDRNPSGSSSGSAAGLSGRARAARGGHRDRRLDRLPVKRLRRGRRQADARAWSAGPASCRCPWCRTPRARWPPRSPTRRCCCPCWPPPTRTTYPLGIADDDHPERSPAASTTPRSSTRRRSRGRGSASGGRPRPAPTPPPRRCSTRRWTACGRSARW